MKIIDLSLDIYDGAPTFDSDPKCAVGLHSTIEKDGSACHRIEISSHHGTHMDAPSHFITGGKTIDQLPGACMAGEAYKIDFSFKGRNEPIRIDDFLLYDEYIREGSRIVYQTGTDKIFPHKDYFTDFPYLTKQAAEWLASRKILMLGMDTPTPNPVDFDYIHKVLLGNNVLILEGMAHLEDIGSPKFILFSAPLKIKGCDASPVRALAVEY